METGLKPQENDQRTRTPTRHSGTLLLPYRLAAATNIHIYVGPGGPYATNPSRSTNIHVYVGPGVPYVKDPGGSTNIRMGSRARMPWTPRVNKYTHLCGARGPVSQEPREIPKYPHLCGATFRTPGGVGPGGLYATGPKAILQDPWLGGARPTLGMRASSSTRPTPHTSSPTPSVWVKPG